MKENIIPELVPDDVFLILSDRKFFNATNLRNYVIKREYRKLRESMRADKAIDILKTEYNYMSYEHLIQIVRSRI